MPLNSRLKRKSAIGVCLPFGRLGPVMDGSGLDTPAQRQVAAGGYALLRDQLLGGGLSTRRRRSSAINVCLPFGRVGPIPDGDNLQTRGERIHAAYGYQIVSGDNPPPVSAVIIATLIGNPARISAVLMNAAPQLAVKPEPETRYRSTGWDAIVAAVDPSSRGTREIAYDLGGGRSRRVFTETNPYE